MIDVVLSLHGTLFIGGGFDEGAEQVRVFLKGRQVDAAGEESRITLSVIGRRFCVERAAM